MTSLTWPFHFRRVGTGLASVVGIFVCIVACLLLLSNARSRILSAVRAYVAGEGLYSKGQKDAVNHLLRYAQTHDERDYLQYEATIAIPLGDRTARIELEKPHPDMRIVHDGFVAAKNHPDDIPDMAMLFRRFRHVSYIDTAIKVWAAGDAHVAKLAARAEDLHSAIASGSPEPDRVKRILTELHVLNAELTVLEDEFSLTLGEANRWLGRRLAQVTYAATAVLLLTGLALSWAIFRRMNAADGALRAQAERWRVTLASIGDAVLVTDAGGVVTALNPVAARMTGWTESDAIGRDVDEVFRVRSQGTTESSESAPRRAMRTSVVVGQDDHSVLVAKSGSEHPIDQSAAPIKDEHDETLGSVLVFRDVSERRRAEESVRRSEERYRSLVAMTTSVVWTSDASGAVLSLHPEWETYTGQKQDQYMKGDWSSAFHPDDRARVRERWVRALREPLPFTDEARLYHAASGRYRHCIGHAVPLFDSRGTVREWIGTWTDVDERKRVEEALQAADRQKDQFMAMLAHELRNPLGPIRNAVHILRHVAGGNTHADQAHEMIDRQVAHMARLLDDLLDVSRVARGKISLRSEVLDLAALVRRTAEDYRGTLELAGVSLDVNVQADPLWVNGDATRLSQVVGNLLSNAAKFAEGASKVSLSLQGRGGHAELVVRDTGIGMKPEQVDHMFEAFAQADQSLDRSRGGLGLGLALVKGLLDLHGGTVHAYSAGVGEGSTFTVKLPLTAAPGRAQASPAASPSVASRARRVLVVEDNLDLAGSMERLLELEGHHAVVAHTGARAIEMARSFRPEIVLCDIGLPGGMNGYEVAQALRRDPELSAVFLIALTGYGRPEDHRLVIGAGFDMHMIKPVDPVLLGRVLARPGTTDADDARTRIENG